MHGDGSRPTEGGRRAAGELESQVLAALWAADGPMTAARVLERLPQSLAYTTVLTILSRLAAKGLVRRERAGRGYAFEPVRDEAEHTAAGMHALLERGSNRLAVLARFVDTLSTEDEQALQELLRRPETSRDV
ncbi:BlaI/MecI/CopY family transcriptional regulator [Kitasatospora sp. NPDC098652]|uniref:BlaI/MecI/CopY family transcriptional regulator n=1 Tax=Kitasatospora sp. NPDC098652 TaxID=3364095 RepID=UPI0037F89A4C